MFKYLLLAIFLSTISSAGMINAQMEYTDKIRNDASCKTIETENYIYFKGCTNFKSNVKLLKVETYFKAEDKIKRYYLRDVNLTDELSKSYSKKLSNYILKYISEYGMPFNFQNMEINIIEQSRKFKSTKFITSIGISKNELKKYKSKITKNIKDIDFYLNEILNRLSIENNYDKNLEFYNSLEIYDLEIISKFKALDELYYLNNYFTIENHYKYTKVLKSIIIEKNYNPDNLYIVPANSEILQNLAQKYHNDTLSKNLFFILSLSPYTKDKSKIYNKILNNIEDKEQYHLYSDLFKHKFKYPENLVFDTIKSTLGNIYFASNTKSNTTKYFKEAQHLFHTKGDLDKIEILLNKSLIISPAHIATYDYLAALYYQKKMYYESYLLYKVLCSFDIKNIQYIGGVIKVLDKLGYKDMADKYYKYFKILTYNNPKTKFINKINTRKSNES